MLTKTQDKIVHSPHSGPIRIIAGPGSGKTRVLTHRIVHLVKEGIDPSKILALTFTNMASVEMRARIEKMLEGQYQIPHISTYHSFCLTFLKRYGEIENIKKKTGFDKNFDILDNNSQKILLKSIYQKLNISNSDITHKTSIAYIILKKKGILKKNDFEHEKVLEKIYIDYVKNQVNMNVLDFDDLIILTERVLNDFEEVRRRWQNRISYLLVDEFQDTSYDQYKIVKHLLNPKMKNLFVVGDPYQTIYTWRGAKCEYLTTKFENDYPNEKTYSLVENFRSTEKIVKAANLIRKNIDMEIDGKTIRDLECMKQEEGSISYYRAETLDSQSNWVSNKIKELTKEGVKLSEIAILYRTNRESANIEKYLLQKGIPYRVHGAYAFLDRQEIQSAISYLTLLNNSTREYDMERIIATPRKGIGAKTLSYARELADSKEISLPELFIEHTASVGLSAKSFEAMDNLKKHLNKAKSEMQNSNRKIGDIFHEFLQDVGFFGIYGGKLLEDERKDNVSELIQDINTTFDTEEEMNLDSYLEKLRLLEGREDVGTKEMVSLMTFHKAKGKEYNDVFVISLVDGMFPSKRSVENEEGIINESSLQEEWRLFYVAITRAKSRVHLSYFESRESSNVPSRFLDSIEELLPTKSIFLGNIVNKIRSRITKIKLTEKEENYFVIGNLVEHQTFGKGKVLEVDGDRVVVKFKSYGIINAKIASNFWVN